MFKKIKLLMLIIILLLFPSMLFAAARPNSQLGCYMVWGLTGDSFGDLDSIHITGDGNNVITDGVPNRYDLSNGDCALYFSLSGTDGTFSMYVYDYDGTDVTSSPKTIRPNDYSTQGNWRLMEPTAVAYNTVQSATDAGAWTGYELSGNGTNYMGWIVPDSITDNLHFRLTDTNPTAGQCMLFGVPSSNESAQTWGTPLLTTNLGTGVETALGVNIGSAGAPILYNGAAGQPSAIDLTNATNHPAATTSVSGISELATTTETSTGTDTGRTITPDGLSGSVYGQKEIGWTIYDSDTATATGDGKQAAVIPQSWYNGGAVNFNLIDFTCSIADQNSATGGATTVVLRRVRGGTPQDMTSTGVTISYNEYTASDEVVDTSYDDVQTGDSLYPDIDAITTGAAQKGLSCTAVFQTP